jgi:UPF0755 protein
VLRKILLLLFILAILILAGCFWVRSELITSYYGGAPGETFVEIPRGSNSELIAGLLADAGVLRSRVPFLAYIRWRDAGRRLQAGEYRFSSPATPIQLAERLLRGDVFYYSVTIPEGLAADEAIDQIVRAGLGNQSELQRALLRTEWIRDLAPQARSLEGYLFPDTYRFARKTSSEQIIHAMVDQSRRKIARLAAEYPTKPGWNIARIVTLASLIEKEVRDPDERNLVASVFENRLQKGMPLACDPTVIYALKLAGKFDGNLHKADLRIESPYNTYNRAGLPPGPITNPGLDSLRAALNPPRTDYLFFVSRNDGTHQFSKDFRAHQIAVAQYQKRMKP